MLIARFGRSTIALQGITTGIDDDIVEERDDVKSVSRETTFSNDTNNEQVITATLDALAREVMPESCRCIPALQDGYHQGAVHRFCHKDEARTLFHYTDDANTVRSSAYILLRDIFDGRKIRLLGCPLLRNVMPGR